MKARLVQIGNSKGVRLPKPLIEQVGLVEDVVLAVRDGGIFIAPSPDSPRAGWAAAAQQLQQSDEDQLLDPLSATRFDDEEWEW